MEREMRMPLSAAMYEAVQRLGNHSDEFMQAHYFVMPPISFAPPQPLFTAPRNRHERRRAAAIHRKG